MVLGSWFMVHSSWLIELSVVNTDYLRVSNFDKYIVISFPSSLRIVRSGTEGNVLSCDTRGIPQTEAFRMRDMCKARVCLGNRHGEEPCE